MKFVDLTNHEDANSILLPQSVAVDHRHGGVNVLFQPGIAMHAGMLVTVEEVASALGVGVLLGQARRFARLQFKVVAGMLDQPAVGANKAV